MAQLVKCLVHRPGGLSSYPPSTCGKLRHAVPVCDPSPVKSWCVYWQLTEVTSVLSLQFLCETAAWLPSSSEPAMEKLL